MNIVAIEKNTRRNWKSHTPSLSTLKSSHNLQVTVGFFGGLAILFRIEIGRMTGVPYQQTAILSLTLDV